MAISIEEVERIAKLARLNFSDQEKLKLQKELSSILDFVDQLKQLKLEDVAEIPEADALNLMRDDVAETLTSPSELLSAAPDIENNFYKVKSVLE
ncbi:MAG TPA: Asp-tRNA(Asn)/Glu-tRNA(Gln) amidotransferase subunit GatC [Patescibacteria group bacterium]|jgi:aspartyl-tRNA(Asn)/glutamyl-tRNA(Gln) amidotransferase subunit C|nr:Asp-tRNA(Asn)/Glu-tRNA(Gln) amidotransferase subunit GatC [Patescibacteria group bacterium]